MADSSTLADDVIFYDVAIAGSGIVGLTLAHALRHAGLTVALIEAQSSEHISARQRAYAFSPMSAQIFQKLHLWEAVESEITPFQRVCMSDGNYFKSVNFNRCDSPAEAVYYGVEHSVLSRALQQAVQNCPDIDLWYHTTLQNIDWQPDGVCLTVEKNQQCHTLRARLLVGADGARSHIRQQAGIKTTGWPYRQSCITAILRPEQAHQNTAYEKFWPSGPFAILPIPDNRCQIVWTAPHAEAQALLNLPPDQFLKVLNSRYGDGMGALTLLSQPLMFPVQLMQSHQYVKSRLALVGDAAHCCHPVGGQGLNMGIRDAAALADVLKQAHRQGQDLGSLSVLKRYERWRRTENGVILGLTDVLNRLFSNQWLPLVWLRRAGFWAMEHVTPLKRAVLSLMAGFFGKIPLLDA